MSQQTAVSHKVAAVHGGAIMRGCSFIAVNGADDDYCVLECDATYCAIYCLRLHGRKVRHAQ